MGISQNMCSKNMAVYTWGLGKSGQLGSGTRTNSELPVKYQTKREQPISVKCGALYTGVVTQAGSLMTSGCGKYGRLGTGDEVDRETPECVRLPEGCKVSKISCGCWHACAITAEGRVLSWGFGKQHGVLGYENPPAVGIPRQIPSLEKVRIAGVACGNNFTLAWTTDGVAFSWGYGGHGVLGHGDQTPQKTPKEIAALRTEKVTGMSAGFAHCGAVTDTGALYMFGKGSDGALGLGKTQDQATPTLVNFLNGVSISEVSCSVGEHHGHTLALQTDGTVYAWGDGYKGKLGLGDLDSRPTPTHIPKENFNNEDIVQLSAGGIHSGAVSKEGHVFTWGCGSDGRLGHPEAKGHRYLFRSDIPRKVDFLEKLGRAIGISCSYYHTAALVDSSG